MSFIAYVPDSPGGDVLFLVNAVLALVATASAILATKECWRLGIRREKEGVKHPVSQAVQNLWITGTIGAASVFLLHTTPFNGLSLVLLLTTLLVGYLPKGALEAGTQYQKQEAARGNRQ